jgi:hypothetical protein
MSTKERLMLHRFENRIDHGRPRGSSPISAQSISAFRVAGNDGDRSEASALKKSTTADASVYPPHELRLFVDFFFVFFCAENSLMALFPFRSVLMTCGPLCPANGLSVATAGTARPTQPAAARINVSFLICFSIRSDTHPKSERANATHVPAGQRE